MQIYFRLCKMDVFDDMKAKLVDERQNALLCCVTAIFF
jgi:hypothetical protein